MKKIFVLLFTAACLFAGFTGCSEENKITPPMSGYWKCSGIGANVLGTSTGSVGQDYLKYFSIGYFGVGNSGKYVRVGTTDFTELSGLLTNPTDIDTWKKFLSGGTFTYDASAKTVTHTSSKGEVEVFNYEISGNTLKLTAKTENSSASGSVWDILSSLTGGALTPTVGVEYTYEKINAADTIKDLFPSDK